jgi:transposase
MEIITGVERRRRWRLEEKLRIVAEAEQPGASFAEVARRHEVSRGLLWNWRRQVRRGELAREPTPLFMPVQTTAEPPLALPPPSPSKEVAATDPSRIEDHAAGRHLSPGWQRSRPSRLAPGHGGGAPVIVPPTGVRVWLANGYTDMRRGMNGLALQLQEALQRDPHAGDLYVFRGRRGDLVKILWHDGLGMSLYAKRLERGRFLWPSPADGCVAISAAQLGYMLDGIDWRNPQRTWRPTAAG